MADLEAGATTGKPVSFDPAELAQRLLSEASTHAALNGNETALHITGIDGPILGEPDRIAEITANLLDNALKFTRDGRVDLVVATPTIEGRRHLRLEVRDTGVGFDTATLAALTDSFTQHDSTYRREFDGLGLGLALVRRYCEIFTVILPTGHTF